MYSYLIYPLSLTPDIKKPNPQVTYRYKISTFNIHFLLSTAHILIFIIKNQNYFPKK